MQSPETLNSSSKPSKTINDVQTLENSYDRATSQHDVLEMAFLFAYHDPLKSVFSKQKKRYKPSQLSAVYKTRASSNAQNSIKQNFK